ncbi:MAG: adenosylcobinamide-GDP ribazoletransferase [Eubacterium sp.]|nr:adenosylcobinamide-GDP ribazoletransferase [Eubacterium sp.]
MKHLWAGFKIAFSMYSKIPVPKTEWSRENMRYSICFFPLVGLASGILCLLWLFLKPYIFADGSGDIFSAAVLLLIPVLVTGGIHLDGFLDTTDALSSYMEREKRLEILKDPRAGAFAIIYGIVYFLFYFGIYTVLEPGRGGMHIRFWTVIALSFVLSRALSGLAIVTFKMAKNTGLAASFADAAQKKTVRIVMLFYAAATAGVMIWVQPLAGALSCGAAALVFRGYRAMAYRKFGGITGDLAGFFLQCCELAGAFAVMAARLILIS